MSRIGKLPIPVPPGVTITVDDNSISVKGPKGELHQALLETVNLDISDAEVVVSRKDEEKKSKSEHGLTRSLVNNMIIGVTKGFEKKLEVNGVGFRVSGGGQALDMALGFSHPVKYQAPEGVQLTVEKMNIRVNGIDKQQVGQVAAEIRSLKKPEPYKGKGIKYSDEIVRRKAGKTGK